MAHFRISSVVGGSWFELLRLAVLEVQTGCPVDAFNQLAPIDLANAVHLDGRHHPLTRADLALEVNVILSRLWLVEWSYEVVDPSVLLVHVDAVLESGEGVFRPWCKICPSHWLSPVLPPTKSVNELLLYSNTPPLLCQEEV